MECPPPLCLHYFATPGKPSMALFLFVACAFGPRGYRSPSSRVFLFLSLSHNIPKTDAVTHKIQTSWWPGPALPFVALGLSSLWELVGCVFLFFFLLEMGGKCPVWRRLFHLKKLSVLAVSCGFCELRGPRGPWRGARGQREAGASPASVLVAM